jgi:uncharacterized protein with ParB-like and HNH nuclease domain
MKYSDIPQFTGDGHYSASHEWNHLEAWLTRINEPDRKSPLILEPDFQRAHVWTTEQQRRYVEYILKGGKSGRDIYFNCSSWMTNFNTPIYLVDGLQRVTAVRKFLNDELMIFNRYKSEIDGRVPPSAEFIVKINNLKTEKEMLQWYIDLNAGGTQHTDDEIEKVRIMLENVK